MKPSAPSFVATVATVATWAMALGLGGGLGGCSSGEENGNPPVLWLDLDGSEIKVRLVEREPVPF